MGNSTDIGTFCLSCSFTLFLNLFKIQKGGGWRDGSVIKDVLMCNHENNRHKPHIRAGVPQMPVFPVLRDMTPSSVLCGCTGRYHRHAITYDIHTLLKE